MPSRETDRDQIWQDDDIVIRPLGQGARVSDFLHVADRVYGDDPAWIPPLRLERRLHLSRQNPFTHHADWQGWVAWQSGQPVGRITAQVDALHRERYGDDTGHFGCLDAIDDETVFRGLTAVAEDWLARRGTRRITGPFNLSINQECGLLVAGFEHPPAFMMPHGRPWFARHLEALDYRPARDLLAYLGATNYTPPTALDAIQSRFQDRIRIRPIERRYFKRDLATLRELFNNAWAGNYGFVPFTEAEFAELGLLLRTLSDRHCIQIAELDGEPAAFNLGIPDLNQAIKDLNGRLFPTGWLTLLWRVHRHRVRYGRVPLMGLRRDLQNTPLGTALISGVMAAVKDAYLARGIEHTEMSWILEENQGMRKLAERLGGVPYKRYRLYEKTIPS
jgi:hypothetical protein